MGDSDPRLGRFLAQWEKDSHEGITIRSVHNRVSGMQRRFDESEREFRERIARVEQNDKRDAENRAFDRAESTGRHAALLTPVQAFPVPGAVTVNVGGAEKKHHSGFWTKPIVTKALGHGLTVLVTAILVSVLHWISAATGVPIQAQASAPHVDAGIEIAEAPAAWTALPAPPTPAVSASAAPSAPASVHLRH